MIVEFMSVLYRKLVILRVQFPCYQINSTKFVDTFNSLVLINQFHRFVYFYSVSRNQCEHVDLYLLNIFYLGISLSLLPYTDNPPLRNQCPTISPEYPFLIAHQTSWGVYGTVSTLPSPPDPNNVFPMYPSRIDQNNS